MEYKVTYETKKKGATYEVSRNVSKTLPEFLWESLRDANLEKTLLNESIKTKKPLKLEVLFRI